MANNENRSEMKGDLIQVSINGDTAWLMAQVKVKISQTIEPKMAARYGKTPLGYILMGLDVELEFNFNQSSAAMAKRALNTIAGTPANNAQPGSELTGVPVVLHDPQAVNDAYDLTFPLVVFESLERDVDGDGLAEWPVKARAYLDATNVMFRVGAAA